MYPVNQDVDARNDLEIIFCFLHKTGIIVKFGKCRWINSVTILLAKWLKEKGYHKECLERKKYLETNLFKEIFTNENKI